MYFHYTSQEKTANNSSLYLITSDRLPLGSVRALLQEAEKVEPTPRLCHSNAKGAKSKTDFKVVKTGTANYKISSWDEALAAYMKQGRYRIHH
ncbi:MAG: hypothetical protein F6K32_17520 [Desertifilum sp. SIO1I2]|nr:hypothetical protein [Desertifilum sp. SIO1I2]